MTALTSLDLDGSAALDLRPLRRLSKLVDAPGTVNGVDPTYGGLSFLNSAAARADPRIAEIAGIEDPATRARELFAYLADWLPPGELAKNATPTPEPPLPQPRYTTADQIALLLRFSAVTHLSASSLAAQIASLLRYAPCEPGTNQILEDLRVFEDLRDALNGIAEVAAAKGANEKATQARMGEVVAAYEAAIERLVVKLDAALAENANLKSELAATLKRAEAAESEIAKAIVWTNYKEGLGTQLAELTVWSVKVGMITGSAYLLGNTPTVTRILAILDRLL